jgi:light-regulated signal transduction histidine kinase (bacteriophytochrome)
MRQLIDDLLDYSRVTRKGHEVKIINLNQIVTMVLADLELVIKEKDAQIFFNVLPNMYADPLLMRQLLQNLIQNAIKFSKQSIPPKIEMSAEFDKTKTHVVFKVKDNGIGFSQKFSERILRPFQRLHSRDEYPGSGIGLAICNQIILKHGGEFYIKSEPGEGSEFTFKLPQEKVC